MLSTRDFRIFIELVYLLSRKYFYKLFYCYFFLWFINRFSKKNIKIRSRIKYLKKFDISLFARLDCCDNSRYIRCGALPITSVVDYVPDRAKFRKYLTRRGFKSFF